MLFRHAVIAVALSAVAIGWSLPGSSFAADPVAAQAKGQAKVEPRSAAGVDKHLAGLRAKLRLTEAQKPQWDAFAAVMRDNAQQYDVLAKARLDKQQSMNAVDDMRSFQELAQAHADGLKRLTAAFQALYEAMTPEQKKNADAMFHERGPRQAGKKKA